MSPPQRHFETSVRAQPHVAIIELHGEINAFAEEALMAAYEEAASGELAAILLDFSDVSYINSTGIALIVGLLADARKKHLRILTYGLSNHYKEIFRITRLSDYMNIYADEQSALDAIEAVSR